MFLFIFFKFCHFFAAYHHQSAVETSGGAADGEEPHEVARKAAVCLTDLQLTPCLSPISLTESFSHKLG